MPKKIDARSADWLQGDYFFRVARRAFLEQGGTPPHLLDGRPIIGICNSGSDLVPCNSHFRHLVEHIKRGVFEAGGLPLEFATMPLGEQFLRPSSFLYRNLVSMQVEETLRANPIDGVVLMTGCDKTTPALLMGAASCDLPTLVFPGGPMLNGKFDGRNLGCGTSLFEYREKLSAGEISQREFEESVTSTFRSAGHCNIMGTASTMACLVETLGLTLPGAAAIPAVDSRRAACAHQTGNAVVDLVKRDVRLSQIVTREAMIDAIRANAAIGGSTNAVIHMQAIAGRLGVDCTLDDWDTHGSDVPCIVDLMPAGRRLMEEFYYAGGMPVVLKAMEAMLHRDRPTVTGETVGDRLEKVVHADQTVIRPLDRPIKKRAGIAVLRGNLCSEGAIIKPVSATRRLLKHKGPAITFETIEAYRTRLDTVDVTPDHVLVVKNAGPRGYPGMPEIANLPLPRKLLAAGVTDMVRISDARMSGSASGTVILHVSPEAATGGTLALVEDGDMIELDVTRRRLSLDVPYDELDRRRRRWRSPAPEERGFVKHYLQHVTSASTGADFDYLVGGSGSGVPRESH
ncbi:MAG: dihydroxy-acid dehydratase [Rhizobiaceae bacterium]|nr:dihydroxy-acid dehydratase [Rhizobiaceae bacterium]